MSYATDSIHSNLSTQTQRLRPLCHIIDLEHGVLVSFVCDFLQMC